MGRILLSIIGIVLGSRATTVAACSTPSLENYASVVAPKNGVVWVQLTHCMPPGGGCRPGDAAETLDVIDTATGQAVPGEVLYAAHGDVIWKPDAALVEDRVYDITTYDPVLTFTAGPAISFSASDVQIVDRYVRSGTMHAESIPCIDEDFAHDSCGTARPTQFGVRWLDYVSVAINLGTLPADITYFRHYLVRARLFTDQGTIAEMDWSPNGFSHIFDEPAEEYCYELQVRSLVDDSETTTTECFPANDYPAVGVRAAAGAEIFADLAKCSGVRDDSDLPRFCEAIALVCDDVDVETCEPARTMCLEVDQDDEDGAGATKDDVGDASTLGDESAESRSSCTTPGPHASDVPPSWALATSFVIALMGLLARRSQARRRAAARTAASARHVLACVLLTFAGCSEAATREPIGATADGTDAGANPRCDAYFTTYLAVGKVEAPGSNDRGLEGIARTGTGPVPAAFAVESIGPTQDDVVKHWLSIENDSHDRWVFELRDVPLGFGVVDGTRVRATYNEAHGGLVKTDSLMLALWVDDELAFQYARSSTPAELTLPDGARAAQDDELCAGSTECGHFTLHRLSLTAFGTETSLSSYEQRTAGDFDVWHGQTVRGSLDTDCDSYFDQSTLVFSRHAPLSNSQEGEDAGVDDAGGL